MKPKDHVVRATDIIAHALMALARINYDNQSQASANAIGAAKSLEQAALHLRQAAARSLAAGGHA